MDEGRVVDTALPLLYPENWRERQIMSSMGDRPSKAMTWWGCLAAGLTIMVLCCGCVTSEIITVTEMTLAGPVPMPPVRVTTDSIAPGFVFSPRVARFPVEQLTGTLGGGTRSYDPATSRRLVWEVPAMSYGVDMDINLTDNFAISAGLTVAQGDQDAYFSGRFGFGVFGVKDGLGVRLDAGVIFSGLDYAARTTVRTTVEYWWGDPETYVSHFADRGSTSNPGVYVQMTLNSVIRDFPVNFFLSGGATWRNLAGFTPVRFDTSVAVNDMYPTDGDASEPAVFFNITPGLSVNLWGPSRLLLGARMLLTDIDNQSPWPVWMPFIQVDLAL